MSDLIETALNNENIRYLYYDREAALTGIDNYIRTIDTLHAKESHTRSSIDRYYRLKTEIPQIIENIRDIDIQLLTALYKYNIAIKKDVRFNSMQTKLISILESAEDKFSELTEKLETNNVIAKPVAATSAASSESMREAIMLLCKQISDAQAVTNRHISDAQAATDTRLSEAQKNSKI